MFLKKLTIQILLVIILHSVYSKILSFLNFWIYFSINSFIRHHKKIDQYRYFIEFLVINIYENNTFSLIPLVSSEELLVDATADFLCGTAVLEEKQWLLLLIKFKRRRRRRVVSYNW